jgi:hypothetical protein
MKITWPQVGALCVVLIPVTLLIGIGKEADELMQWLSIMVPAIFSGAAFSAAKEAKVNAEAAKHNTNGRMTQLIEAIREKGGNVPAGYEDVDPDSGEFNG